MSFENAYNELSAMDAGDHAAWLIKLSQLVSIATREAQKGNVEAQRW